MRHETSQEQATLLDVLIDGFEKNEMMGGFHWRTLPMPDESAATSKFASLADEGTRWKGPPARFHDEAPRRLAAWPDLEIRQAGRRDGAGSRAGVRPLVARAEDVGRRSDGAHLRLARR